MNLEKIVEERKWYFWVLLPILLIPIGLKFMSRVRVDNARNIIEESKKEVIIIEEKQERLKTQETDIKQDLKNLESQEKRMKVKSDWHLTMGEEEND